MFDDEKCSNSARLPQCLNLTISKAKEFCKTSFKNGKLNAELTASYQCVLRIVPLHLCKVLRLPRKSGAKSYNQSAAPVSQNHLRKPEDLMLQHFGTPLTKSAA